MPEKVDLTKFKATPFYEEYPTEVTTLYSLIKKLEELPIVKKLEKKYGDLTFSYLKRVKESTKEILRSYLSAGERNLNPQTILFDIRDLVLSLPGLDVPHDFVMEVFDFLASYHYLTIYEPAERMRTRKGLGPKVVIHPEEYSTLIPESLLEEYKNLKEFMTKSFEKGIPELSLIIERLEHSYLKVPFKKIPKIVDDIKNSVAQQILPSNVKTKVLNILEQFKTKLQDLLNQGKEEELKSQYPGFVSDLRDQLNELSAELDEKEKIQTLVNEVKNSLQESLKKIS